MTDTIEKRLEENGITLPEATAPAANYVPTVRTGNQLFISGQIPMLNGKLTCVGQVGSAVSTEDAYIAARLCAINLIAQAKLALGDLGRVKRVVKLVGFVNSAPGFPDQPKVINGASDLMVAAFGESGAHARSAVGVAGLPFNVSVEVEAILEVE